ncbi:hypothetical protein D3C77_493250 [compost metagenome]
MGQASADGGHVALRDIGQQQALPRCHAQAAITQFAGKLGSTTQHRRIQTAQRRSRTDGTQASLLLWINPQIAAACHYRATPLQYSRVTTNRQAELRDKCLWRILNQQLTHPRLLRSGQIEKAIKHRQHQLTPLTQRDGAQG